MDLKETELCLGLPGDQTMMMMKLSGKRGFSETVDLKLNLQSSINNNNNNNNNNNKNNDINNDKNNGSVDDDDDDDESGGVDLVKEKMMKMNSSSSKADHHQKKMISTLLHHQLPPNCSKPPAAKAQVVGWPPVRSYRKNVMVVQKSNIDHQEAEKGGNGGGGGGGTAVAAAFVKVCMDGAPYLRKVDLKMYKSYQELSDALAKMFSSFTMGNYGTQGMIDFMNESKLMDLLNSSEYVPTYEDKDGDWMLVGDVPWEMFVDSCKRLRIMKGSEAIGLAPRAMEKCKNRC